MTKHEREIQRLRAAMDDAGLVVDHRNNPVSTNTVLRNIATRLRKALEAK